MLAHRANLSALVITGWFSMMVALAGANEGMVFFEEEVRPILVENCYQCHSEESGKRKGGLWLDRKAGWSIGGDGGPVLVPGDLDRSKVVHAVRYTDTDLQMPPKSRLSKEAVRTLEKWVALGAPDPRTQEMVGAVRKDEIDYELARKGWAFRPLAVVAVPEVADSDWIRDSVDAFVLAELEADRITPAEDAPPADLLRRVHYDLTGLPPTKEELDGFLSDPGEDAFVRVVDELLSRPAFGEKWGKHWLDVARYADSNGGDRNYTFFQAWRYRNWVIDAFNRDISFYDFVRSQLAGDLLPADSSQQRSEQLIASTFLSLGPKMLTERDKEKLWMDTADEQLDTVGRAFLGLTLGCARCHDHKFDPVSQEDYYAMAGIFRSTEVVTGTRNGCVNVASWVEQVLPIEESEREVLTKKVERLELAMRLAVEKTYMKKAGGKMTLDDLPLAGVIYDEADAELVGDWKESTFSVNRFGEGYVHDDKKGKGTSAAVFRGSLPESGKYEVRIAYSPLKGRATKVPITVMTRGGGFSVILDETREPEVGGLFQPIGQWEFEKGGRCSVTIGTEGTEGQYVIVDAVQFIPVEDIEREASAIASVEGADVDPLLKMNDKEIRKELEKLVAELKDEALAMAPREAKDAGDCHLRVRGEVSQIGPKVARGFLKVLHEGEPPSIPSGGSGRLELAEWIASEANPLLDRVMVNRIWFHLFGRGIVETVDNFGRLGSGPSHPELLDYLASAFRAEGGSVKGLVRKLVLTRAYCLSSEASAALAAADPENEKFGRQNRRRLTAEEIRDSVLFLSGDLDREPRGATANEVGADLDKPIEIEGFKFRTVYLPVARNNLVPELSAFDAANPDLVSGQRAETTVPTQALYLLNSEFIQTQSATIGRLAVESSSHPGDEVDWIYQTLLGRTPNPVERQQAMGFIAESGAGTEELEGLQVACGHFAHVLMISTEFLFLN